MTWLTIFEVWSIGAVGAFPAAYEHMVRPEDEGQLSAPAAFAMGVVVAALWPIAWAAMIVVVVRGGRA